MIDPLAQLTRELVELLEQTTQIGPQASPPGASQHEKKRMTHHARD